MNDYDDYESERYELRAQDEAERAWNRRMIAHPDPSDPDCPLWEVPDEEEDEEEAE